MICVINCASGEGLPATIIANPDQSLNLFTLILKTKKISWIKNLKKREGGREMRGRNSVLKLLVLIYLVVFLKWYLQCILDGVFIKSTKEQLLAKYLQVAWSKRFVTRECLPVRELHEKRKKVWLFVTFGKPVPDRFSFFLIIYRFQDFPEVIVSLPVPVRRVTFSKHLLQSFNCYSHLWDEAKCKCQLDDGPVKVWGANCW